MVGGKVTKITYKKSWIKHLMSPKPKDGFGEQAGKRTTILNPVSGERVFRYCASMLKCLEPCHTWSTLFGEHLLAHIPAFMAVCAPNSPYRQVLASVQKVPKGPFRKSWTTSYQTLMESFGWCPDWLLHVFSAHMWLLRLFIILCYKKDIPSA